MKRESCAHNKKRQNSIKKHHMKERESNNNNNKNKIEIVYIFLSIYLFECQLLPGS